MKREDGYGMDRRRHQRDQTERFTLADLKQTPSLEVRYFECQGEGKDVLNSH